MADAWCAAFVLPKTPGRLELPRRPCWLSIDTSRTLRGCIEAIQDVSARYRWFHWHLEFPHIFEHRSLGS